MTLVADPPDTTSTPPAAPPPSDSPVPAWRVAGRLARRETLRRPGRTALVALLISIPVVAMTLGSIVVRTHADGRDWPDQFARRYGTADVAVDVNMASSTAAARPALDPPLGTRTIDYLWVHTFLPAVGPEGEQHVVLTDAPLDDPMVSNAIEVLDGRAPEVGEVLIGPDLAEARDLAPGDELTLDRPSGAWTVSGIGRYRDDYWVDVLVVPGFDRDRVADDRRNLVEVHDLPDDVDAADIITFAHSVGGMHRFQAPYAGEWAATPILGWGWVAGALSLVAVGIIVAAAFATSARGQLVTIGQLAANGATPGVIRRSLALQGTWTALIGTSLGLAVGFAALPVTRRLVAEHVLNYELAATVVSTRDLVVIALTAVVAGTVAALVPARSAAAVPVMSALAGRRPQPSPPRWLVPTGLALTTGGLALLGVAGTGARTDTTNSFVWPLLVVIATVGVVFGMVCATPLVVARIGRLGRGAPLSWRLALRSLGRSRTRSAAVVAAIAVTVGGAVAGSAVVEKVMISDRLAQLPAMPADAAVVSLYDEVACCETPTDAAPLPSIEMPADIAAQLDALLPGATYAPMVVATYDPPLIDWTTYGGPFPDRQGPVVATPPMLELLGLHPDDVATLQAEGSLWPRDPYGSGPQEIVTDETGAPVAAGTAYPTETGDIVLQPPLGEHVPRYGYGSYRPIVTPEYAEQVGFELVERGVIVRHGTPLTVVQREVLESSLRLDDPWANGTFVEPGDPPAVVSDGSSVEPFWTFAYDEPRWRQGERDLWAARMVVLAAALLLTGLVVAIGLSLAAAEGRDERDTLAVIGARPSTIGRQAGARAAVLVAAGIALGVPTGYLPAWVLFRTTAVGSISDGFERPLQFPWLVVGALVVLVPTIVAAGAWAATSVAGRLRPTFPTRRG